RLVVSISSDKAVWDAIKNNELVRKLLDLPLPAVENGRPGNSSGEAEPDNDILQWILDFAKAKVTELVLKFQSLLNEVFRSGKREKPNEETRGQLEEEIRSSLILSIVILLIVIVARAARKSGLRRATKKVRQREDDPSDVGDMTVDRGEEAPVTFKDKLIGWDRNNKGEEDYEDDD
ncbi:hypothetical protein Gohar_012511, partial [Gossypium harknessii]|nr:hypothetical protein [Gossypium harknessii]